MQIKIGDIQNMVQIQENVTDVDKIIISESFNQINQKLTRTMQILKSSEPNLSKIDDDILERKTDIENQMKKRV